MARQTRPRSRTHSRPVSLAIEIRGARTHNLQSIDVDLPHDEWIVITGPSGCGKSSLAIDTVFAEGQRQYIETLSTFTRQYLDQLPAADVDSIAGLLPTVKIDQHQTQVGPRSTVGTLTEIHDFLRILFARAGDVHCHRCGNRIGQQSIDDICRWIMRLPEGTRLMVLAPMIRGRKGKHTEVFEQIRTERLVRVRVDGVLHDIENAPELDVRLSHTIEAITDRIVVRPGLEQRLRESVELAFRLTGRLISVAYQAPAGGDAWNEKLFCTDFACPDCDLSYPEVEPRTFSFNSPHGACAACQGLGVTEQWDWERLVPDRRRSLQDGALVPWRHLARKQIEKRLNRLAPLLKSLQLPLEAPLATLSESDWQTLWQGQGSDQPGLLLLLESDWATAIDARVYESLESARLQRRCPECQGTRLGPAARAVTVQSLTIADVAALSLESALDWVNELNAAPSLLPQVAVLAKELTSRLQFLIEVGLGYLSLDRAGTSLSGGEMQRVRLATAIGTGLTNVCFVLDEPSIGLHSRDTDRLIGAIRKLRDGGNLVLVVEHDEQIMRAADRIIDLGPGAGRWGGQVVANGTPEELARQATLTGDYLSGRQKRAVPEQRRTPQESWLVLTEASGHNLKQVQLEVPLGLLVAVTGVSGSGKSTLINQTLAPALFNHFHDARRLVAPFGELRGKEHLERLVEVDQRPIGRNSRSCPATYCGVFDDIRQVFSWTRQAKQLGLSAGRFSFNSGPGRCPDCLGLGEKTLEMKFLPNLNVVCGTCDGQRYQDQILSVRYRDLSIADVLRLSIAQAADTFSEFPKIQRVLQTLVDVGLGYLSLGQSASTLSGGEAQRIKLATELAKSSGGRCLYLLDEPTTGLHVSDVQKLLALLQRLVDKGNSVLVIEHHLDVITAADWVIDIGPEGGQRGGEMVVAGPPELVAARPESHTGRFLRAHWEAVP